MTTKNERLIDVAESNLLAARATLAKLDIGDSAEQSGSRHYRLLLTNNDIHSALTRLDSLRRAFE